jgi:hypothetical protein
VLVPAGEDAAVLRFYDTVRGRVVDASALVARPLDPEADPLAPADVAVRPLDWEPVKLARIDDDQPALEP